MGVGGGSGDIFGDSANHGVHNGKCLGIQQKCTEVHRLRSRRLL